MIVAKENIYGSKAILYILKNEIIMLQVLLHLMFETNINGEDFFKISAAPFL